MATNHTYDVYSDSENRKFHVLKTKANNIKLVNFVRETGAPKTIRSSSYYGMNGSFFYHKGDNHIMNIAYQDGKPVGISANSKDGETNSVGTSVLYWDGRTASGLSGISTASSSAIPKATGTWAQGGIGLYLCDANWKAKYDAELTPYDVNDEEYRAGMIVNNQTNYVYLFVSTALAVTVVDFRAAMMGYLGLIDGGSNRGFRAIMVDGGRSAQLWNKTLNAYPLGGREVAQIIALRNNS